MTNIIKISDYQEDPPVGYCGTCDSDAFKLILNSDNPEKATVVALMCYGCGERIDLAPIIVECKIDDE